MRTTRTRSMLRRATWVWWRAAAPVLVAAAVAGWPGAALGQVDIPPGFEVVRITPERGSYWRPQINNLGQIVFSHRVGGHGDHDGEEIVLYDPRDESFTYLTDNDVQDWLPDINDAGQITWTRVVSPERRGEIMLWSDGEMRMLTDNDVNDASPEINNLGHIAWKRRSTAPCTGYHLLFYDGATTRTIAGDEFSNQGPSINDNDDIAWTRYNFCVNPWEGEIMLYSGGRTTQLTSGGLQRQGAALNDRRTVAWSLGYGGTPPGIEQWQSGKSSVVTPPAAAGPYLNQTGIVLYSVWEEERRTYHAVWQDQKQAFRLTNSPEWAVASSINDLGEAVFELGYQLSEAVYAVRRQGTPGDTDGDGDLDLRDYARLQPCVGHPAGMGCTVYDLDLDDRVTRRDAGLQAMRLTGPR